MNLATIPLFDYILLAVLILFVVHGLWVGFFRQLPFALSLIGSYAASALYAGQLMPHLAQITQNPKGIFGGSFLILLIVSTLLLKLIGKLLGKVIQVKVVGWGNRLFLGAPLALVKGLALVVLLVMFLAASLSPADHFFRASLIAPYLEQGSDMARSAIQDTEIRKDLRPRKAPPVEKKVESPQQVQAPIQQEEMPLNPAPQQVRPSQAGDDPASSTEIVH
ncbi:MAG: CvpA family protein [Candidatus Electrothrix sp. AUS4]|nr:CvpA family protein [Candidatus Electrothrix sp. AUS4]